MGATLRAGFIADRDDIGEQYFPDLTDVENRFSVLLPEMSMPVSCMTSTTRGLMVLGSSPALCASKDSGRTRVEPGLSHLLRALLWMQTKRTLFFIH